MTAHELAHKLLSGPNTMVTVRGYEGGVDEIHRVYVPRTIHLNAHSPQSYYGEHEYCNDIECWYGVDEKGNHQKSETVAIHLGV